MLRFSAHLAEAFAAAALAAGAPGVTGALAEAVDEAAGKLIGALKREASECREVK